MFDRRIRFALALACGWPMLALAQATATAPGSVPPLAQPAPFEGKDWRLIAYWDGSKSTTIMPNSRPTSFRFADGQISGTAGCNQLQAQYRAEGEVFRLASGLAATRMACPGPLMQQESAVIAVLQAVAYYRLTAGQLELLDEGRRALLSFAPLAADIGPQALTGHPWRVEGYADAQGDLVKPASQIELVFDPQGQISGFDGCNRYLSGFVRSGQTLSLGPIAVTAMTCPAGPDRERQARAYREALARVQSYRILRDRLTLLDASQHPLVELRPLEWVNP